MTLTIRLETPADTREVEELTREAFWGVFHPTCDCLLYTSPSPRDCS